MKPIDTYTRAQAIADGQLHDVSVMARQAGIKIPVATTQGLMHIIKDIPPRQRANQDVDGRLYDVLAMTAIKIRVTPTGTNTIHPSVLMSMRGGKRLLSFRAVVHGGDNMEPVMTLMLNNED